MTTPTSVDDTKLGQWSHVGTLKSKYISDALAPKSGNTNNAQAEVSEPETDVVIAESGSTVKMRVRPSTDSSLYWDVPVGAMVNVMERGEKWSKISYGGNIGYMMTKFLSSTAIPAQSYICHIVFKTKAEADALKAKYNNAWVTEGVG